MRCTMILRMFPRSGRFRQDIKVSLAHVAVIFLVLPAVRLSIFEDNKRRSFRHQDDGSTLSKSSITKLLESSSEK